jgi:NADH:ubiquinone oxidoreductase subunit 3 (subunit A)
MNNKFILIILLVFAGITFALYFFNRSLSQDEETDNEKALYEMGKALNDKFAGKQILAHRFSYFLIILKNL